MRETLYKKMMKFVGPIVSAKKLKNERLVYELMRINELNYRVGHRLYDSASRNGKFSITNSESFDAQHHLFMDAIRVNYELAQRMGLSEQRIDELRTQAREDTLRRILELDGRNSLEASRVNYEIAERMGISEERANELIRTQAREDAFGRIP